MMQRFRLGPGSTVLPVVGGALLAFVLPSGLHAPAAAPSAPHAVLASDGGSVAPAFAAHRSLPTAPVTSSRPAGPVGPPPVVGCPIPPVTLTYNYVGNVLPPSPLPSLQTPCNIVDWDEVHGTFESNQLYSGERFTVPVYLPPDSSNQSQSSVDYEMYVGMVVKGDVISAGHQSYVEVTFTPAGTSWTEEVAVWSFINDSYYGGNENESYPPLCQNAPGMAVSWYNAYWCVVNQVLGNTTFATQSIPSGSWVDVTYAGDTAATTGLNVWVNVTGNSALDESFLLNATNTGSHTFEPFFNSSCQDLCILNWSFPFGLGVGMWPEVYTEQSWRNLQPVTIGIPHFWQSGSYAGDYAQFGATSTSGVCNGIPPPTAVAQCVNFDTNGGTGFYPWFSYRGWAIDFGANYTWTTVNWGGANGQFNQLGGMQDHLPLFVTSTTNSSLVGYSPPAVPIWVNSTIEDLGTVTSASVSYTLNGGSVQSVPMSLVNGNTTDGSWSGALPASLGNGFVNFTVVVTNHAGATLLQPPFVPYVVQRGPLPTFHTLALTNLQSCGGIVFNGTVYTNGTTIDATPGFYPAFASGCYPWNFTTWVAVHGVSIVGSYTSRSVVVALSGDAATLETRWQYVRPNDTVHLTTSPALCGQISIGNQTGADGDTLYVPDGLSYSLGTTGCASKLFAGWTFSGNFTILGGVFTPNGNGTLTANYVDSSVAVALTFITEPTTCGGILYRGAGYTTGEFLSVAPGTYTIGPDPCAHFGFLKWNATGQMTANGTTLTVTGPGTLMEVNQHLTEIRFVVNPNSCGWIDFDGVSYHNGDVISVQNNSTHLAYPVNVSSCHLIAFSANGGLTLNGNVVVANGSGNLTASFATGPATGIVTFLTDPSFCGAVVLNGVAYQNSNFTSEAQGLALTIAAEPCAQYGFVRWITFGIITVIGNTAWINGSGAIEAVFQPMVTIIFETSPQGCGFIVFDGTNYLSNSSHQVPLTSSHTVQAVPCAGERFTGWQNTTGLSVNGGILTVNAGGILTAFFVPIVYPVTFLLDPATCGSYRVNSGARIGNGTTLQLIGGVYQLSVTPCTGDHIDHWEITGNVSVAGAYLWVNGSGSIKAFFLPVPPTIELSVPSATLVGVETPIAVTVAVLVPPFNYNFSWDFGDGSLLTTPANFTSHTFHTAGTYTVSVTVRDPYNRTATASAVIQVQTQSASARIQVTSFQIAAFGVIAVALVAIALIVWWRNRVDRRASEPEAPIPAEGPSSSPGTEQKP